MRRKGFLATVLLLSLVLTAAGGPGASLAQAPLPAASVTVPPGTPLDIGTGFSPVVACNTRHNEYLVVWMKDEPISGNPSRTSIHIQRVSAAGALLGSSLEIRYAISPHILSDPAVAYSSVADEYLVVWSESYKLEASGIRGQRIAADGTLRGSELDIYSQYNEYGAFKQLMPDVAYSATSNVYLVVWYNEEAPEIWGAAFAPDSASIAGRALGPTAFEGRDDPAHHPRVAWRSLRDEFLVVWYALGQGILARRLSPAGPLIGVNPPPITTDGVQNRVDLTYSSGMDQYLVVWDADYMAYGQRLTVGGMRFWDRFELPNERWMGGGPDPEQSYLWPVVAYNVTSDSYVTAFETWYRIYYWVTAQHYTLQATPINYTFQVTSSPPCTGGIDRPIRPADLAANPTADEWLVAYVVSECESAAAGAASAEQKVQIQRISAPTTSPATSLTFQEGVNGYAGTQDTWINAGSQAMNYGGEALLAVRTEEWMKPLVRFDLRGRVPADAIVTGAQLDLWLVEGVGDPPLQPLQASAHRIFAEWYEEVATWILASWGQPWVVPGAKDPWDVDPLPLGTQRIEMSAHWVSYDVRDLARRWLRDPGNNFGVAVVSAEAGVAEYHFASSEYSTVALRPRLRIQYVRLASPSSQVLLPLMRRGA